MVKGIRKANSFFRKRPRGGLPKWFKRKGTWFKNNFKAVKKWVKGVETKLTNRIKKWGKKNIPAPVLEFWKKIKPYASVAWRVYNTVNLASPLLPFGLYKGSKELRILYGVYKYVYRVEQKEWR